MEQNRTGRLPDRKKPPCLLCWRRAVSRYTKGTQMGTAVHNDHSRLHPNPSARHDRALLQTATDALCWLTHDLRERATDLDQGADVLVIIELLSALELLQRVASRLPAGGAR